MDSVLHLEGISICWPIPATHFYVLESAINGTSSRPSVHHRLELIEMYGHLAMQPRTFGVCPSLQETRYTRDAKTDLLSGHSSGGDKNLVLQP